MTSSPDKTRTPTADESAATLTQHLRQKIPFFFIRLGDGAIECIHEHDRKRHTCDGEVYSPELGRDLLGAWDALTAGGTKVFAGDWQSASFGGFSGHNREAERWDELTTGRPFEWLHFEALLLMRESKALVDFYRAIREDRRRKVYMGPAKNAGAARFLRAYHHVTGMVPDLITQRERLVAGLDAFEAEVVLYGAGMAGNVVAVDHWGRHPDRTYISLGSALDPLFGHKTRSQQLPAATLRRMFKGML